MATAEVVARVGGRLARSLCQIPAQLCPVLSLPWESLTFNWTAGEFHIVAKGPIRRTHLQGGKAGGGNERAKYARIEDRKLVSGLEGAIWPAAA